jgi:hypothetical protein
MAYTRQSMTQLATLQKTLVSADATGAAVTRLATQVSLALLLLLLPVPYVYCYNNLSIYSLKYFNEKQ